MDTNQPVESEHEYCSINDTTTENNKLEEESKVKTNDLKLSEVRKKTTEYENCKETAAGGQSISYHKEPEKPDNDKTEENHVYETVRDC